MSNSKIPELKGDDVDKLFLELLYQKEELKDGKPIISPTVGFGVQKNYGFFPARIEAKREEIKGMLLQLPHEFMESSGSGGHSFLLACETKDGKQWTDLHLRIEQLISMGSALGLVEYPFPKEMWSILTGGMPYFVVKDQ